MSGATKLKWRGRWDQFIGRLKTFLGMLLGNEQLQMEGEYDRTIGWYEERAGTRTEELMHKIRK